jgi:hypothetical protein
VRVRVSMRAAMAGLFMGTPFLEEPPSVDRRQPIYFDDG